MKKTNVTIEVHTDDATGDFVSLKIADGQPIPLPKDKPAPRRLASELADAVKRQTSP